MYSIYMIMILWPLQRGVDDKAETLFENLKMCMRAPKHIPLIVSRDREWNVGIESQHEVTVTVTFTVTVTVMVTVMVTSSVTNIAWPI